MDKLDIPLAEIEGLYTEMTQFKLMWNQNNHKFEILLSDIYWESISMGIDIMHMGQVMKVRLSCYLVLLSNDKW